MKQVSSIANRIKEYREREGLTLADLGKITGVPAQTLNRYELGKQGVQSSNLRRVTNKVKPAIL